MAAFDFPSSPTVGTVSNGYTWDGEKWLSGAAGTVNVYAPKKNYIINGAMMVSQENGAAASGAIGYYPVDMFYATSSNSGVANAQQMPSLTPAGSPNRIRITVITADTSVAAGDYYQIIHSIEGNRVADLRSGLATAKTVTLQFGIKAPAGTYCVTIRNGTAANRFYAAEYTISAGEANTDVIKSITLKLDTTGTWVTDNTAAIVLHWWLMVGSTYAAGTLNTWVGTANGYTTGNQFNFMATVGNVFELFDVSLTEGTTAPPFVVPDYASELTACQRYWRLNHGSMGSWANTTTDFRAFEAMEMRAAPVVTIHNATNAIERIGVAFLNISAVSLAATGASGLQFAITTPAAAANTPGYLFPNSIKINARL